MYVTYCNKKIKNGAYNMKRRLIIDGNAVYELDEECMLQKKKEEKKEQTNTDKSMKQTKKTDSTE